VEFNFFVWIREAVKQAVLLGVSDAVEQIGIPPAGDEMSQQLQHVLNRNAAAATSTGGSPQRVAIDAKRKRLGRSLKDLETDGQKAG
jgi:hypothetical protein